MGYLALFGRSSVNHPEIDSLHRAICSTFIPNRVASTDPLLAQPLGIAQECLNPAGRYLFIGRNRQCGFQFLVTFFGVIGNIDYHDGTIWADAAPTRGATVSFKLPRVRNSESNAGTRQAPAECVCS